MIISSRFHSERGMHQNRSQSARIKVAGKVKGTKLSHGGIEKLAILHERCSCHQLLRFHQEVNVGPDLFLREKVLRRTILENQNN
jgi:hypothetical protein